jgi:hypothetical protein
MSRYKQSNFTSIPLHVSQLIIWGTKQNSLLHLHIVPSKLLILQLRGTG